MSYSIKEVYYTLQGEGAHAGRPAVFLRFTGCNLWTGREEDRHKAVCQFCDTNFIGTDGLRGSVYQRPDVRQHAQNIVDGQQRAISLSKCKRRDLPIPVNAFVADDVDLQRERFCCVGLTTCRRVGVENPCEVGRSFGGREDC